MTPEVAAIIVAAISSVGSLAVAAMNHIRLGRLHVDVNSRLDAALLAQRQLGRAEGRAEGADAKPGPPHRDFR